MGCFGVKRARTLWLYMYPFLTGDTCPSRGNMLLPTCYYAPLCTACQKGKYMVSPQQHWLWCVVLVVSLILSTATQGKEPGGLAGRKPSQTPAAGQRATSASGAPATSLPLKTRAVSLRVLQDTLRTCQPRGVCP